MGDQIRFVRASEKVVVFHGYGQELKIFFLSMDDPATSVHPDDIIFGPTIAGLYIEKDTNPLIQHPIGMEPEEMELHIRNLRQAVLFCKEFKERRAELYEIAKEKVIEKQNEK